jgi:hypothetical protein
VPGALLVLPPDCGACRRRGGDRGVHLPHRAARGRGRAQAAGRQPGAVTGWARAIGWMRRWTMTFAACWRIHHGWPRARPLAAARAAGRIGLVLARA